MSRPISALTSLSLKSWVIPISPLIIFKPKMIDDPFHSE